MGYAMNLNKATIKYPNIEAAKINFKAPPRRKPINAPFNDVPISSSCLPLINSPAANPTKIPKTAPSGPIAKSPKIEPINEPIIPSFEALYFFAPINGIIKSKAFAANVSAKKNKTAFHDTIVKLTASAKIKTPSQAIQIPGKGGNKIQKIPLRTAKKDKTIKITSKIILEPISIIIPNAILANFIQNKAGEGNRNFSYLSDD